MGRVWMATITLAIAIGSNDRAQNQSCSGSHTNNDKDNLGHCISNRQESEDSSTWANTIDCCFLFLLLFFYKYLDYGQWSGQIKAWQCPFCLRHSFFFLRSLLLTWLTCWTNFLRSMYSDRWETERSGRERQSGRIFLMIIDRMKLFSYNIYLSIYLSMYCLQSIFNIVVVVIVDHNDDVTKLDDSW